MIISIKITIKNIENFKLNLVLVYKLIIVMYIARFNP